MKKIRDHNPAFERAGFTLVELVVIMGLVGVLAGFLAPLVDVSKFRQDAAALEISTTLGAAQRNAVLRGHNFTLAFDLSAQRILLHYDANNDGTLQSSEEVRVVALPEGVAFGLGGAPARPMGTTAVSFTDTHGTFPALRYYRSGSASEAGIIYLTSTRSLTSAGFPRDGRAIEVERATGQIRCFSYKTAAWKEKC